MSPRVDITPADVNSAAGTFAREQSTLDDTWGHLAPNNGVIRSFYKPSSPTYWGRNSPGWGNPVQWN